MPIKKVLTAEEIAQILRISYDMIDVYHAGLLENVLHIECEIKDEDITVELYPSLRNPYLMRIPSPRETQEAPQRIDEGDLYEKRKKHKIEFASRRHEIVLDEIRMRNHDIEVHKFFLSQAEGYDVGWLVAAAHWLKTYGPGFYDLSKKHHQQLGMDFEWKGMERAVGIVSQNREAEKIHYVVVRSMDFSIEEHVAQWAGGVIDNRTKEMDEKKAAKVREKLNELCAKYFCTVR